MAAGVVIAVSVIAYMFLVVPKLDLGVAIVSMLVVIPAGVWLCLRLDRWALDRSW